MAFEGVQRLGSVPQVEQVHAFIVRSRDEQVLVEVVEVERVDFAGVGEDLADGLLLLARVPDMDIAVVATGGEDLGVELVPADVFDGALVCAVLGERLDGLVLLGGGLDVPEEDFGVVAGGEEEAGLLLVPREAVSFLGVAEEPELGPDEGEVVGLGGVLAVVEDAHLG